MQSGPRALLSVLVGLLVGTGGYWLAADALVAIDLGVAYAVLTWLAVGHYRQIPATDTWAVNRWNALLGSLAFLAVSPFVNSRLGLSLYEGVTLAVLAYGLAGIAFLVGVAMVRDEGAGERDVSATEASGVEDAG